MTSGGATNLVAGLATANYDSVPLVMCQVARNLIGNDVFQEVVGITRSITSSLGRAKGSTGKHILILQAGRPRGHHHLPKDVSLAAQRVRRAADSLIQAQYQCHMGQETRDTSQDFE